MEEKIQNAEAYLVKGGSNQDHEQSDWIWTLGISGKRLIIIPFVHKTFNVFGSLESSSLFIDPT